jgi:hypothetical protein
LRAAQEIEVEKVEPTGESVHSVRILLYAC